MTAYDPQTGTSSRQMVEHVWINHDTDLIDLTLHVASDSTTPAPADASGKQQEAELAAHGLRAPPADEQVAKQARDTRESQRAAGKTVVRAGSTAASPADETVHTTAKHPWLTADRGFVKAGELRIGERVVRLDGTTAVVATERALPGAADYYNLEVSHLHTFAVGEGRYVVHNCGAKMPFPLGFKSFGQFKQFSKAIKGGLVRAGYRDVDAAFTGSSVTGRAFKPPHLAFGSHSDYDIALVGKGLFNRAGAIGVGIRGATRTDPLEASQIAQLGLDAMHAKLTRLAGGRVINFMIYQDHEALALRGLSRIGIRPE